MIIPSGTNIDPTLQFDNEFDPGGELGELEDLIKDAKQLIKNNPSGHYFQNCIFTIQDLKNIALQPGCEKILFSHVLAKKATNDKYSTLIACGSSSNSNTFLIESSHAVYISFDIDSDIDTSPLIRGGFSPVTNIEVLDSDSISIISSPAPSNWPNFPFSPNSTTYPNLPTPRKYIKKEPIIISGIYYKTADLESFLAWNQGKYDAVALFPIPYKTYSTWTNTSGTFKTCYFIVSYLMVPMKDGNIIYNPSDKLIASIESWPDIWHKSELYPKIQNNNNCNQTHIE